MKTFAQKCRGNSARGSNAIELRHSELPSRSRLQGCPLQLSYRSGCDELSGLTSSRERVPRSCGGLVNCILAKTAETFGAHRKGGSGKSTTDSLKESKGWLPPRDS